MATEKKINSRIQQKHDVAANWAKATNFIPQKGEIIIYDAEYNASGSETQAVRFKIGDGTRTVNNLPFAVIDYNSRITTIEGVINGLGSAAQKDVDSTIGANSTSTNLPTSQAVEARINAHSGIDKVGTVTSVKANGISFNPDTTGKVDLGNLGGGSGPLTFADVVVMTEAEFSAAYLAGTLQDDKLYLIEGETGTVNFVSTADHIVYNNANSGLTATNLQGAVDEINSKIFSGSYNDLTNKPTLFSGSYNDLTDKPTLFSGSYDDLTDKPTLFSGSYNDLTDKPNLFSGSYNDLTDKPAALTQTDILTLLNLTEEQLTKLIALLNKLTVDTTSVKFNNTIVKATTFDVQ